MPEEKESILKRIQKLLKMSIENQHRNIQRNFENDLTNIKDIEDRISLLRSYVENEANWLKKNRIEQEIEKLKDNMNELLEEKEQNNYYLNIARIIKTYKDSSVDDVESDNSNNFMQNIVNSQKGKQNKQLYKEFNNIVNNTIEQTYGISTNSYFCDICKRTKLLIQTESNLVCEYCGTVEYYLDNNQNTTTYEQEIHTETNINHGIYKRMSHFNDILSNCQAKNNVKIPEEVIDKVKLEINKEIKKDTITQKKIKNILKKINCSKYYEHANKLISILTNKNTLQIPVDIEQKLKTMFRMIQEPFEKHRPDSRSNFLSYSYCFYQLLTLLDEDKYTVLFPLLKSKDKLREQDIIWKKICNELDWEFNPAPLL